uniref:SCP domain-containing protein n=1 Tax=Haemonchus contortus TaxID=6289 RepID=W6NDY0_HAECO
MEEDLQVKASLVEGDDSLPKAANMRFMAYNCSLEEEATKLTENCERFPNRNGFTEADKNFATIDSNEKNGGISVASQAALDWWSKKSQWPSLKGIASNDNEAIPFLLVVNLCKKGDTSFYNVACIYGRGLEVGRELYKEGPAPCTNCTECYKGVLCKKVL